MQHSICKSILVAIALVAAFIGRPLAADAQGTAFTYQGRLNNNGAPANGVYDFRFRAAVDAGGNNFVGTPSLVSGIVVTNGLFTAPVDFGAGIFNGSNVWLQVEVRTNGVGGYSALFPPQPLTPAPYAITAGSVSSGGLPAVYTNSVAFNNPGNSFSGNGTGLTGLWQLTGNSGTVPAVNFLGTTDNQPLEFRVNGARGFRIEPTLTNGAVNVIGGGISNSVAPGVVGATIGGGGAVNYQGITVSNRVIGDFGVVAGGAGNVANTLGVIGGGLFNNAIGGSTVAGGSQNSASGGDSTIGGGSGNTSSGVDSTVAGGAGNTSSGASSAVGGGSANVSGGQYSTVPGGAFNNATGSSSFAAGTHAKANHNGAFVWADSQLTDFVSTANNEFLVRALGGVGIGTNNPGAQLHVASTNATQLALTQNNSTDYARFRMRVGVNPSWEMDVAPGATPSLQFWNASLRVTVDYNGNVFATAFNPPSDRNAKENFEPVDPLETLEKVSAMPISRWNFKIDSGTTHIGPMAQDFHAAFDVGIDDKHIATVDADGVAFAAIQGLNQKLAEELKRRDAQNAEMKQQISELRRMVDELKLIAEAK